MTSSERSPAALHEHARRMLARRNVIAGLMFMAIAIAGLWISRNYPVGTALRMGTGYMPRLLSWVFLLLGGVVLLEGIRQPATQSKRSVPPWERFRPIVFVTVGMLTFALCIERLGLVVSIFLLIMLGSLATRELRLKET